MTKHIWEGWTVQDFVDELTPILKIKAKATVQTNNVRRFMAISI